MAGTPKLTNFENHSYAQTPLLRFAVDLLRHKLYDNQPPFTAVTQINLR